MSSIFAILSFISALDFFAMNEIKPDKYFRTPKTTTDLTQYTFGKLPPQALPLEESVLGAIMIEGTALNSVIEKLMPESFYTPAHQKIYAAISNLFSKNLPVDILTVIEELKKQGNLEEAGGAAYISGLTNKIASGANAEFHAAIIAQKFIQRELIRISTQAIKDAYEDTSDALDLLDNIEQELFKISEKNIKKGSASMSQLIKNAIDEFKDKIDPESGLTGVPTGFNNLDKVTSGWQKSDLVILAARPGMGKTAFVLSMTRNAAVDFKQSVAFFSLEMSSSQLVTRLIAAEAELEISKLRKGNLSKDEWAQLHSKIKTLEDAPIFIDDTPAINILELRAKCRKLKQQHDVKLIIIDYLQLMSGGGGENKYGGGNREQEISTISRGLKRIAKELNVPVIALSQLNRSVESRSGEKIPQLSDLRESGAIEQDADMVMFIYRAQYYNKTQDTENKEQATLKIAKHRNGELTDVHLRFVDRFAKFENLNENYFSGFVPLEPPNELIKPSKMNDMPRGDEDDF